MSSALTRPVCSCKWEALADAQLHLEHALSVSDFRLCQASEVYGLSSRVPATNWQRGGKRCMRCGVHAQARARLGRASSAQSAQPSSAIPPAQVSPVSLSQAQHTSLAQPACRSRQPGQRSPQPSQAQPSQANAGQPGQPNPAQQALL